MGINSWNNHQSQKDKYDYFFKILIIGDPGVGKTQFLYRFTEDTYIDPTKASINYKDFRIKCINHLEKKIKLQIWDSTPENCKSMAYYKGARGIILMYDIANQNSFKNIPNWIKQIEYKYKYFPKEVSKVLVGNNCDTPDRVVSEEEGEKLAKKFNLQFFETSVKTNQNVSEVFYSLVDDIITLLYDK